MKPQDLMIGDWVIRKGHENTPLQVIGITDKGVILKLENGWCSEAIDLIKPIPLTPEILDKNGFKKQRELIEWTERDIYYIGGVYGDVNIIEDYYPDEKFTLCRIYYDYEEGTQVISFARIDYVHELQRALKVLNIEKDIII